MKTAKQFRDNVIGKAFDVDGAPVGDPIQCVDLFKKLCYDELGMKPFALGGTGYADEIMYRFDVLGLGKHFNKKTLAQAQYGDVIVWKKGSTDAPYSHVAFFIKRDGASRIVVLGQNQGGKKAANELSLSTNGIIGVLRPKGWETPKSNVDQLLHVGEHCKFASSYTVEDVDVKKNWIYNSRIGGWFSATIAVEVAGGKVDQLLHVGEKFTIPGTFTVSAVDVPKQLVFLKELGFWVKAESLTEVA